MELALEDRTPFHVIEFQFRRSEVETPAGIFEEFWISVKERLFKIRRSASLPVSIFRYYCNLEKTDAVTQRSQGL